MKGTNGEKTIISLLRYFVTFRRVIYTSPWTIGHKGSICCVYVQQTLFVSISYSVHRP